MAVIRCPNRSVPYKRGVRTCPTGVGRGSEGGRKGVGRGLTGESRSLHLGGHVTAMLPPKGVLKGSKGVLNGSKGGSKG
eukprot:5661145-Pyramimonas_sp.AAC.1